MRLATAASPTCCAPPVLIVTRQLVSPAAPNPAPPSGKLAKYTMPASRPAASNAASANSPCETGHDRSSLPAAWSIEELFWRRLLTLKPSSLNEFGHHGFVGFLLALDERPIMTCDNAVTKPHFGQVLSFSQQLKFRGAFSVEPHAHKTVQYGHGRSRQSADKCENEFYVKTTRVLWPVRHISTCIHTTKGSLGSRSKSVRRRRIRPLSHLPDSGYCIAATILIYKVPALAQGLLYGL